jgi:hypothetical protein
MPIEHWYDLLPPPFDRAQDVTLILAPVKSKVVLFETGGSQFHVLRTPNDSEYGLQIISPRLKSWQEHEDALATHGFKMGLPRYIGPIEDLPSALLADDALIPLLFCNSAMSTPFLQLRQHIALVTKGYNASIN